VPQEAWKTLPPPYPPKDAPLAEYDLFDPYFTFSRDDPRAKDCEEEYGLEPGVKYHELSVITVQPGTNLFIKVQFYELEDPDPMTVYTFFSVPKNPIEPAGK